MARLAAELRRIHVRRAAISGDGHHQQIDNGGQQHNVKSVAKDAIVEIDLGKFGRNLPGLLKHSVAQEHAYRNEYQPANEESRQNQEEDDAEVGVCTRPPKISTSQ